jgi:hypothetical protein
MDRDEELVNEAIEMYRNGKTEKFHIARGKLKKAKISESMGLKLLQFATELPNFPGELRQPHKDIVENAARVFNPQYIELIRKDHLRYNESTWEGVISLLLAVGSKEAINALKEILVSAVGRSELRIWEQLEVLLAEDEDFVGLPYLDWLARLEKIDRTQAHHIRMVLMSHVGRGWLDETAKLGLASHLNHRLSLILSKVSGKQRLTPGSWMFAEDYIEARNEVCEVIDLLGQLKFEAARENVRQAMSFADSRIKFFAMFALNVFGEDLNVKDVEEIANYPEMRGALVEKLQGTPRFSLIPATLVSQLALAEADLVQWLTFPTELDSVPDEIKFLKKVEAEEQSDQEIYHFRFRIDEPHWAAEDGWMIGWSGPFPKQGPLQLQGAETFSKFEKWDGVESVSVVNKLRGLFKPK